MNDTVKKHLLSSIVDTNWSLSPFDAKRQNVMVHNKT